MTRAPLAVRQNGLRKFFGTVTLGLLLAGVPLAAERTTHEPDRIPMALPMVDAEVLLMGDCQAWGWTFTGSASFPRLGPNVQVLGLPSMTVDDLRANIARLSEPKYKKKIHSLKTRLVVLHVGAADIATDTDPGEIAEEIMLAVGEVRDLFAGRPGPQVQVVVIELLDRARPEHQARVDTVNSLLRDLGALHAVYYATNTWGPTPIVRLDIPLSLQPDGVHLNAEGYAMLADEIEYAFDPNYQFYISHTPRTDYCVSGCNR